MSKFVFRVMLAIIAVQGLSYGKAAISEGVYYPTDKMQRESGAVAGHVLAENTQRNRQGAILVLRDGHVVVDINSKTGEIICIKLLHSGSRIFGSVSNTYIINTIDSSQINGSERDDNVCSSQRLSDASVKLVCSNPTLPSVVLTKTYTLKNGMLSKNMAVTSLASKPMLFSIGTIADPLLENSTAAVYGVHSDPGYFPEETPVIFTPTNWGPSGCHVFPAYVRPKDGVCVGMYLYKINDRFVYARENEGWEKTENNFMKCVLSAADFVGEGHSFTAEFHIRTVNGDGLDFYRTYQQLSGYKALMSDQTDPKWFDLVRYVDTCGPFDMLDPTGYKHGDKLPQINEMKPSERLSQLGFDPDSVSLWVLFGWGSLGCLPTEGSWNTYEPAVRPMAVEEIRWCMNNRSKGNSRFKNALYDWNCSFDPQNYPYSENPSWATRDAKGNNQLSFFYGISPWWPKDTRPNYLNDGYRKFYLGQVGKLPETYGVEFNYIDADIGSKFADWPTHTWFQPYHNQEFLKAYRKASGKELPLVRNNPNSPYASGALWEGRGLTADGFEKRWKAVGGKMLIDKIWQWKHRWAALMAWCNGQTEPYYSNYIVGLGYKPFSTHHPIRDYPYMQAAFEMRHLVLVDAKFSPCFWRNDDTDVEAYLLKQSGAIFLSCIGHAAQRSKVEFWINKAGLPFKLSNPLFVWQITLDDPRSVPDIDENSINSAKLEADLKTRRVAHTAYIGQTKVGKGLKLTADVRPTLLTVLAISQLPAFVVQENGIDCQMQVPSTADTAISGKYDSTKNEMRMNVISRLGCKLALLNPDGHDITRISFGKSHRASKNTIMNGTVVTTVDLPKGTSVVNVVYSHK